MCVVSYTDAWACRMSSGARTGVRTRMRIGFCMVLIDNDITS